MFKKIRKQIGYWLFLFAFILVAAEIILRIYNPFPTSVIGDKITLHSNTLRILDNVKGSDLDSRVTIIKNSLAFRGPEPPAPFKEYLTILTVGGSTTECLAINEEKTWPALLSNDLSKSFNKAWVNNAGLNGHSTHGHIKLLQDYIIPLKPKICLFLIGCNDIDRPDLGRLDSTVFNENQNLLIRMARFSRLINVCLNFYRYQKAKERELVNNIPFSLKGSSPRFISDSIAKATISWLQPDVERYGTRVKKIIQLCKTANILPIFITQPCLLGEGVDDVTGTDLASFPYRNLNGKLLWLELKLYNEETKRVCEEEKVMVMDLALQLPKSSKYIYDIFHFNNAGCEKISELVSSQLENYLKEKFPEYHTK